MIQNSCETSILFALCTPKGEIQIVICIAFFKIVNIDNNIKTGEGGKDFHVGIVAVCFPYKTILCEAKIQARMRKYGWGHASEETK